jgi:NAD(P)-dependent dehydrogenase (short-subunit alcohol dehydrogenase family)
VLLRPAFLAGAVVAPTTAPSGASAPHEYSYSLSSIAHRYSEVQFDNINLENDTYDKWAADAQSKCEMIWLANEIDRRYSGQGIRAFSVQHGGI